MKLIWAIAFCVCCSSAFAQGTFQNLDFEDANIVPVMSPNGNPNAVNVADALPGWTVNYGSYQQTQITYNDPSLGGTGVTLIADGYPTYYGGSAIDGNFSVLLQAGRYNDQGAAASISQTGQIPLGTQSLLFEGAGEPQVFVGNDLLTLFQVESGTGPNGGGFTLWGANISAWSGQTEQLTFSQTLFNTYPPGDSEVGLLDDISFSPNPITVTPEPDALTLMGIGGSLFAAYRRFAPKRK